MKKVCMFLILNFICISNVFASSIILTPKEYIITLKNVNTEEINKIEIIYGTNYSINYEINNDFRTWLEETSFGYKYKDYTDEEIIPKLSSKEQDTIAETYLNLDVNLSDIDGYWLKYDGFESDKHDNYILKESEDGLRKYAIYKETKVTYYENNIEIKYPSSKKLNEYPYIDEDLVIRVEMKDGTVIYSELIHSNLITQIDSNTLNEQIEKEISNKTAYFEVDFLSIDNNFEVVDISDNKNDNNRNLYVYSIVTLIVLLIILSLIIFRRKKYLNK